MPVHPGLGIMPRRIEPARASGAQRMMEVVDQSDKSLLWFSVPGIGYIGLSLASTLPICGQQACMTCHHSPRHQCLAQYMASQWIDECVRAVNL